MSHLHRAQVRCCEERTVSQWATKQSFSRNANFFTACAERELICNEEKFICLHLDSDSFTHCMRGIKSYYYLTPYDDTRTVPFRNPLAASCNGNPHAFGSLSHTHPSANRNGTSYPELDSHIHSRTRMGSAGTRSSRRANPALSSYRFLAEG
jgi:hypothetical protein